MPAADPPPNSPLPLTPPTPAAEGRRAGLREAFVRGMVWSTLALLVTKFASLIATVAVAWRLGEREYGAYSAARGNAIFGDVLTDGGMRRVLITRGAETYERDARVAFGISLTFNTVGALLMCVTAALIGQRGGQWDVSSQLFVTALALVLSTFGSVQRARLAGDLRFARAAYMYSISAILRNLVLVALAFTLPLRWAALSFALPLIVIALWEAWYARRVVGPLPPTPPGVDRRTLVRELLGQGKWVMFATLGAALVARGDYLVASHLLPAAPDGSMVVSGQYMFAFQLTFSLFSPLTIALATVIQPVMAQLRTDPARQADAFRRMVRVAIFLATPAAMLSIAFTPLIIHPIRAGYWDDTVVAIQILAASECVRQLYHMSIATLEASGRFRWSAIIVTVDGVLTLIAATIGCTVGGGTLLSLTLAVAIQRTLTAIGHAVLTDRLAGGRARLMVAGILPPLVIGAVLTAAAVVSTDAITTTPSGYRWLLPVTGLLAMPLFAIASRALIPETFGETCALIAPRFKRRASSV